MWHRQSAHQRIYKLSSSDQISSARENPELLSVTWICITWMCMTWKSCWKGWLSTKVGDGDLLKVDEKLWTVLMYSWFSNELLSSWDIVLGKNGTEHNKAATLTWLVVSPQLSRQQVFVRMLSRPKYFTTNSEQTFAGLREEVQICYKIRIAVLSGNFNESSWRSKLNGKY